MDGLRVTVGSSAIQSVDGLKSSATQRSSDGNAVSTAESFGDQLKKAIESVDSLQKAADQKMQELATGKSQNIHETMIATEKADLALRLMVQVRNKVIDAYQEIMKMQV